MDDHHPAMRRSACSRRQFLGGAASALWLAGGGAALLAGPARAALSASSYSNSLLVLESGGSLLAVVTNVSGGDYDINYVQQTTGETRNVAQLVPASATVQPLRLELREPTLALTTWIGEAIEKGSPLNCSLTAIDPTTGTDVYRYEASSFALTGIELESLDATAASTDVARFTIELTPRLPVRHTLPGTRRASLSTAKSNKVLLRNAFRLYLQGLESSVNAIAAVGTVALRRSASFDSVTRTFVYTPWIGAKLPIEVALSGAAPFYKWYDSYAAGQAVPRSGQLQLLSADFTLVRTTIEFVALGLAGAGVATTSPSRAAFELQPLGMINFGLKNLAG